MLRGGRQWAVGSEKRERGSVTDGKTVGFMREEADLIFSRMTQSSEVLVVVVRL